MANDSPNGLVHCSERLLSVPLLPRQILCIHKHTQNKTEPLRQHQACSMTLWEQFSLTFSPGVLFELISSKNCIFKMIRGSILGGKGRPVMITPRPKMSAKSRPSLAWQKILREMLGEGSIYNIWCKGQYNLKVVDESPGPTDGPLSRYCGYADTNFLLVKGTGLHMVCNTRYNKQNDFN